LTSFAVDILDIVLNLTVMVLTGSAVMIAQTLQGISDLTAAGLLLIGLKRSGKPADALQPFGYGKELYFWTLLSGFIMVAITASLSFYFGWRQYVHPEPVTSLFLAIGALTIGLISNGYAFSLSARRLLGSQPLRMIVRAFLQSVHVETKTTFILDLAGTCASIFGLAALVSFGVTGDISFDGLGAMIIAVTMALLAIILLLGVRGMVVGRGASPATEAAIHQAALAVPRVDEVLDLRTMYVGPDQLLINLEIHLAHDLDTQEIERLIDQMKTNIRTAVPSADHIQIELETPKAELRQLRQ
jgi:cation diffusion facilitator family transporter